MDYVNGWMHGFTNGDMTLQTIIGVLVAVLLVVVIIKQLK